jgi:xanthine dehydrogenase accessory factor
MYIHKFARILGYQVTVIDNRAEVLTKERFPDAHKLILGDIVKELSSCEITESTNIVIATHNHEFDEPTLQTVVSSQAGYIGVLGNSRRVADYFRNLEQLGIPEKLLGRIYSPVGLDLGGKRTSEIALAVVAEIQAVKYGRTGGFKSINKI